MDLNTSPPAAPLNVYCEVTNLCNFTCHCCPESLPNFHRIQGVSTEWVMGHVRAGQETFAQEIRQSGFKQLGEDKILKENYFLRFEKAAAPDRPLPKLRRASSSTCRI